jgi:signal transduction histidine kinase
MFARHPFAEDTLDALASVSDAIAQGVGRKRIQEVLRDSEDRYREAARRLAVELRPIALDDLGLSAALASYLEQWSERNGIAVDFHSNGLLNRRFTQGRFLSLTFHSLKTSAGK